MRWPRSPLQETILIAGADNVASPRISPRAIPFRGDESFSNMRVVIKVGTSLIAPGGQIDANLLRAMVDQFDLSKHEYLIVTSGAIAAGMSRLRKRVVPG